MVLLPALRVPPLLVQLPSTSKFWLAVKDEPEERVTSPPITTVPAAELRVVVESNCTLNNVRLLVGVIEYPFPLKTAVPLPAQLAAVVFTVYDLEKLTTHEAKVTSLL